MISAHQGIVTVQCDFISAVIFKDLFQTAQLPLWRNFKSLSRGNSVSRLQLTPDEFYFLFQCEPLSGHGLRVSNKKLKYWTQLNKKIVMSYHNSKNCLYNPYLLPALFISSKTVFSVFKLRVKTHIIHLKYVYISFINNKIWNSQKKTMFDFSKILADIFWYIISFIRLFL